MCGIVYVKRKDKKPAYKSVLKRYRAQKGRGQQGFGYVAIKDGQIVNYRRAPTEAEIVREMAKETAEEILFHHRFPTSVPNIEEAAHPLLIEHESLGHQYFVAHNGVIRNTDELKKKHEDLGFKYCTEILKGFMSLASQKHYHTTPDWNDSESLAVETALMLDGKQTSIGTEGAAAVVGLQTNGMQVVNRFFYRNNVNPLHYHEDKVMITLTSNKGVGTEVTPLNIYKIKNEGGFEMFGPHTYAPASYKPYKSTPGMYGDDDSNWQPHRHTPMLPPASHNRSIGFGRDDDRDDDALYSHFTRESTMRSLDDVLGDVDAIQDRVKARKKREEKGIIIGAMTLDQLWAEYDKTVGAEEQLEQTIEDLDNLAEDMYVSEQIFEQKLELETKLVDIQSYLADLSSEITAKESEGAIRLTEDVNERLSR